jgi:hypothetical protein
LAAETEVNLSQYHSTYHKPNVTWDRTLTEAVESSRLTASVITRPTLHSAYQCTISQSLLHLPAADSILFTIWPLVAAVSGLGAPAEAQVTLDIASLETVLQPEGTWPLQCCCCVSALFWYSYAPCSCWEAAPRRILPPLSSVQSGCWWQLPYQRCI